MTKILTGRQKRIGPKRSYFFLYWTNLLLPRLFVASHDVRDVALRRVEGRGVQEQRQTKRHDGVSNAEQRLDIRGVGGRVEATRAHRALLPLLGVSHYYNENSSYVSPALEMSA